MTFDDTSIRGCVPDGGVLELSNGSFTYIGNNYQGNDNVVFDVDSGASLVLDNMKVFANKTMGVLFRRRAQAR